MKKISIIFSVIAMMAIFYYWSKSTGHEKSNRVAVVNASSSGGFETSPRTMPATSPTQLPTDDARTRWANMSRVSEDVLPLVNRISPVGRTLHDRLVSERRDDVWAAKSEADIRAGYNQLEGIGGAGRALDIECGSSVCQVSGSLADMPNSTARDALHAVQSLDLQQSLETKGYRLEDSSFGKGGKGKEIFVSYFTRIR